MTKKIQMFNHLQEAPQVPGTIIAACPLENLLPHLPTVHNHEALVHHGRSTSRGHFKSRYHPAEINS
jgi:hypothetical protein